MTLRETEGGDDGEKYVPKRTPFGTICDEFVILLETCQTDTLSGNAELATLVQRLALVHDYDYENAPRSSDE